MVTILTNGIVIGFSQKVRSDPDLAKLRELDEFDELMDKYDEPFINENAIKALSSVFGIFGKK